MAVNEILPLHPTMRDPRTGEPLRAFYRTKYGRLVWPVMGGDGTGDPAPPPPPAADPPAGDPPAPTDPPADKPLGPGGEKALQAEREARKALEKQIAALAPLQKLAEALGTGTPAAAGKNEVELLNERFAQHEKTVAEERAARWRAEVAHEKGLTPQQAARLVGATREDLVADADALVALFPAAAPPAPGTPKPDPSQGARGAGPTVDSRIAEAQAKGDWRTVISLQNEKLANLTT